MRCEKKFLALHFEKEICLYSTYSSFLVTNVCNQGKTLCSPCSNDSIHDALASVLQLSFTMSRVGPLHQ